jgi:hypothetical protein
MSESPLPYMISVSSRCLTNGVAYSDDQAGTTKDWVPLDVYLQPSKKSRAESSRTLHNTLTALQRSHDEAIEVRIGWTCKTHLGSGTISPPLIIQVDTKPATT